MPAAHQPPPQRAPAARRGVGGGSQRIGRVSPTLSERPCSPDRARRRSAHRAGARSLPAARCHPPFSRLSATCAQRLMVMQPRRVPSMTTCPRAGPRERARCDLHPPLLFSMPTRITHPHRIRSPESCIQLPLPGGHPVPASAMPCNTYHTDPRGTPGRAHVRRRPCARAPSVAMTRRHAPHA
ncbi:hypothetical protein FA95DRAFT_95063 [Auriscalpium vulgare]|uniref:Uncharacterized protein n=1 Tax=Auriscalpium vulgare TaxID=40419 RepID=A0ACB8RNE7_9AGAM|nr:hypothetical protein FA95DRAFT_95063 [Auriscalpium vulgare]